MKSWYMLPIAFLFSLQAVAVSAKPRPEGGYLLTPQEFKSLTFGEQKTYVRTLRAILVEMNENNPHLAAEMAQKSGLFAVLWNKGVPSSDAAKTVEPQTIDPKDAARVLIGEANKYITNINNKDFSKLGQQEKLAVQAQLAEAVKWAKFAGYATHEIPDGTTAKGTNQEKNERKDFKKDQLNPAIEALEKAVNKVKALTPENEAVKNWDETKKDIDKGVIERNVSSTWLYNNTMEELVVYGGKLPPYNDKAAKPAAVNKAAAPAPASVPASVPAAPAEVSKPVSGAPAKVSSAPPGYALPASAPAPVAAPAPAKGSNPPPPPSSAPGYAVPDTAPAKHTETTVSQEKESKLPREENKDPNSNLLYRCMYAGFVIKKESCMAPQEFPGKLEGVNQENFKCGDGTVMCNPLVFGVKLNCDFKDAMEKNRVASCLSSSKPFCVKPGMYATKNCSTMSSDDDTITATVYLLSNNENNKNLMKDFSDDFYSLCDPKMLAMNRFGKIKRGASSLNSIRKDIAETCAVAKKRVLAFKEKYQLIKSESAKPADVNPHTGRH
jgi:hypothetical protein